MPKTEEEIFCDAFDIPISLRKEFVRKACGENDKLRKSVERLLELHDTADGFLATPVIELNTTDLDEQPGDLIGSYRLDTKIGEGGFGIVWRADQLAPIKRLVAIKIFKLRMDAEQVMRRFDEERQALAMMNHANIATVLDAGTTSRGRSFIAMELVEGKSIDKYCLENRLSTPQKLDLFANVCRAVQHAHQKGVVHLDLKPSNILVAEQDSKPLVKIIDFGIAKVIQNTGSEFSHGTEAFGETGESIQLVGTPEYMSPEQLDSPDDVDSRSDIYSLGAVLYKLLAGVTPLEFSAIEKPASLKASIRLVRESTPTAPSRRLARNATRSQTTSSHQRTSHQKIPEDLDCITLKALHKDPAGRYQSANEMARDIERHLSRQIVSAVPWTLPYAFRKFVNRNRLLVAASALVLLATVGGLIAMAIGLIQADSQRSIAINERKTAETERAEADRLRNIAVREAEEARLLAFLLEQLVGGANPEAGMPADFSLREQLDQFAATIEKHIQLAKYPLVEARLRNTMGRAYSNLRELEKAGPNLYRALELRLQELPPDHPFVMESRLELARFLVFDANASEARIQIELVLDELESMGPSLNLAKAYHVLSEVNSRFGSVIETFRSAEQAWQVASAAAGPNALLALDYQSRAGFHAIRTDGLERAENLTHHALNGLEQHWPDRTFEINRAKGRMVTVLVMQRRFQEALPLIDQVIEENASQLGNESHYQVTAILSKVTILRHLKRREEAEELLWKAVEIADRATNERSRAQTMAYRRLAAWVQRDNRPAEAEALWAKAIRARRKMDGDTVLVSQELTKRSYVLRELARNKEAEECLEEAVRILRSLPRPNKNIFLETLYQQADQKLELGLDFEALAPLGEAIGMAEEVATPSIYPHVDYIQALINTNEIQLARRSVQEWESVSAERSDKTLAVIVQIAQSQIAMSTEEFEPASKRLTDSVQLLRSLPETKGNIRLGLQANNLLVECYLKTGDFQKAEDILLNTANDSSGALNGIFKRRAKRQLELLYQSWGKTGQANDWMENLRLEKVDIHGWF